jgi:hypothetical protein
MASKWKVKEGTQVAYGDKVYGPGESFSASKEEIDAEGLGAFVDEDVDKPRQQSQSKAANKAQAAPAPRESK